MTDLTRRDALMLTAVIAATTSSATVAEAADTPPSNPPQNDLLTVPSGAVANTSIPISLKIPVKAFAPDSVMPSSVQIAVTVSDTAKPDNAVLTATLKDMALPAFKDLTSTPAIMFMTRLKVGMDKIAKTSPQTTVTAILTMTYPTKSQTVTASQNVTVTNEDCASSDVAVMRLSLQPPAVPSNAAVMVRAIVPPVAMVGQPAASTNPSPAPSTSPAASTMPAPAPSSSATPTPSPSPTTVQIPTHKLTAILCTNDSGGTKVVDLTIADDRYLSPEVFVGFSIFPRDKIQKMNMAWTYVHNAAITGSAYPDYTLNASGLAVVSATSS